MESLEKLTKSFRVELLDRLKNPFVSAFYLSAAILNWEIWVLLFAGDISTEQRIDQIISKISLYKLLWYPLFAATVYSIAFPFTLFVSNTIWSLAKYFINMVSKRFDNKTYLSLEKSVKLKMEMHEFDKKYLELFKEKSEIKEEYKAQLDRSEIANQDLIAKLGAVSEKEARMAIELSSLKSENIALKERLSKAATETEIGEIEEKILKLLVLESPRTDTALATHLNILEEKTKYHLDRLGESNLVVGIGNDHYAINPNGRKYYFENIEKKNKKKPTNE